MKTFKILFAAVLFFAISTGINAQDANTDNASINASATVFTPISIAMGSHLAFGNIAQNETAAIALDGTATNAGYLESTTSVGLFNITGSQVEGTQIQFTGITEEITLNGPDNNTLTVAAVWEYETDGDTETPTDSGNYDLTEGAGILRVAGSIDVGTAAEGTYETTVQITVEYSSL